jgi:hypothetical protein
MYILVIIVLGLCLWYVSTIKEGALFNKKRKNRRSSSPTDEGVILNQKMDAILVLEDKIKSIEETLKYNSDQINDTILPQLTSLIK